MEELNKQFNSDLIITNQIKTILNRFKIKTVVETGTYIGNTTKWFGMNVKSVHSIEIDKNAYYTALRDNYHDNIKFYLGSSKDLLDIILPNLNKKELTLFYLDAHSHFLENESYKELQIIGKYFYDNCIIVIDDFLVPNRPLFQYDIYDGYSLEFKYISEYLSSVFSDYIYFYPNKVNTKQVCDPKFIGVGKIYLLPKILNVGDMYFTEHGINYTNF